MLQKGQCRAQVVKKVEKELFEKYKDENLDVNQKNWNNVVEHIIVMQPVT